MIFIRKLKYIFRFYDIANYVFDYYPNNLALVLAIALTLYKKIQYGFRKRLYSNA